MLADVLRDAGARRTLSLSVGSEVSGDTVIGVRTRGSLRPPARASRTPSKDTRPDASGDVTSEKRSSSLWKTSN